MAAHCTYRLRDIGTLSAYLKEVMVLQVNKARRIIKNADKRKERNRIAHSAPGSIKVKAARKKKIVAELD